MPEFSQQIVFQGVDNVTKTVNSIMTKVGALGVVADEVNAQFQTVSKTGAILTSKLKTIGLAAAGVATAAFWMSYRTSDAAESLLNLSQKTGVSAEELQKLNYVADQSNIGAESLAQGFTFLNRAISSAATDASGEAAQAFKGLGIDLSDTQGNLKNTETIFYELSDAFEAGADGPNKVQTAVKLMGRAGAGLIPILNRGSEALRKHGSQFEKYGNIITKDGLNAIADFNDVVDNAMLSIRAFGSVIAQTLIPYLQPIVQNFADWVASNRELIRLKLAAWVQQAQAAFTAFIPKLEAAWDWVTKAWKVVGGFEGVLKGLAALLAADLLIAFSNFTMAVAVLSKIIAISPIGRFIGLLTLVGVAVVALNKVFPQLGETVVGVVDIMFEKFGAFFDWATKKIQGLLEALHIVDKETNKQTNNIAGGSYRQTLDPTTGKVIKREYVSDNQVMAPVALPNAGATAPQQDGGFSNILKMLGGLNSNKMEPMAINLKLDTSNKVENIDIDAPLTTNVSVNAGATIVY